MRGHGGRGGCDGRCALRGTGGPGGGCCAGATADLLPDADDHCSPQACAGSQQWTLGYRATLQHAAGEAAGEPCADDDRCGDGRVGQGSGPNPVADSETSESELRNYGRVGVDWPQFRPLRRPRPQHVARWLPRQPRSHCRAQRRLAGCYASGRRHLSLAAGRQWRWAAGTVAKANPARTCCRPAPAPTMTSRRFPWRDLCGRMPR